MSTDGKELAVRSKEPPVSRTSEPPHGASARIERAASMPQTQVIFIDREVHAAAGQGSEALDQGRKKGLIESSYLSPSIEFSGAYNIAASCLLEKDHKVIRR